MKLGIIGCGHMAEIIMRQALEKNYIQESDIIASAKHEYRRADLQEKFHIQVTDDNAAVAEHANVLLIGLKPQDYGKILGKIKDKISTDTVVVSLAVGITIERINEYVGKELKVIRIMPNVAAAVGEGVTGYCISPRVSETEVAYISGMLSTFGQAIKVHEEDMEIVSSIGSAAPAFVYIMIEALADGAVAEGLKRDLAYRFASQMVLGTGKLVRESGKHPAALKDTVCSPGGTTIEGVSLLEEKGFRSAVIQATRACVEKSRILANK